MKRAIDCVSISDFDNEAQHSKVERHETPGGVPLVNSLAVAKKSYVDAMELSESVSTADSFIQANARNRLDVIGKQMKNLQELMTNVFEESQLNAELHTAACNFVKKPGHIYHLYERPSGQKYWGMLSPEEWHDAPHKFLGSWRLEADYSFTLAKPDHDRYEGLNYLKEMFAITQTSLS